MQTQPQHEENLVGIPSKVQERLFFREIQRGDEAAAKREVAKMSKFHDKFESSRQDWETPQDLFNPLNDEFHFTLDAAASNDSAKVKKFFSEEQDGLSQDWGKNVVWLNPPYGLRKTPISAWVEKAYKASLTGATTVMLIPARTNTNWFHEFCLKGEVRFIRGRPKFGGAQHGLPHPLCLVVFRPPRRKETNE